MPKTTNHQYFLLHSLYLSGFSTFYFFDITDLCLKALEYQYAIGTSAQVQTVSQDGAAGDLLKKETILIIATGGRSFHTAGAERLEDRQHS